MKVHMNKYGQMTISAESEVEEYALARWYEAWPARSVLWVQLTNGQMTELRECTVPLQELPDARP